jgi:hypothetical protein
VRRAKGTIHVFTFKEGVLSPIAHDLRLRIERFAITLEGDEVRGEFDLRSLIVCGAIRDGVAHPAELDASKRAEIERAMHANVLRTSEHPTAHYVGLAVQDRTSNDLAISGTLELRGRLAPLSFYVRNDGGTYRAQIELCLTGWGIAPYRALFGAIRLKDAVRIDLALTDVP